MPLSAVLLIGEKNTPKIQLISNAGGHGSKADGTAFCYINRLKSKPVLEQLRILQEKKLRRLLAFAYEHSPYYHNAFETAGLTAETVLTAPLSAFPALDKTVLLEQFDRLVTVPDATQEGLRRFDQEDRATRAPYLGKYHVVHSSGSTGKPGYFLYDQAAWNQMLLGIIRGALWG